MAEAKKMMDRPEYQAQMKKMSNSKEFKDGLKKSGEMMKDPAKAAATEAKLEHMVKVGNDELKKGASNVMEDAMDAMNNPEVMAEMTKMIKDPQFQEQLAAMAKDPSFKSYVDAVSIIHVDMNLVSKNIFECDLNFLPPILSDARYDEGPRKEKADGRHGCPNACFRLNTYHFF